MHAARHSARLIPGRRFVSPALTLILLTLVSVMFPVCYPSLGAEATKPAEPGLNVSGYEITGNTLLPVPVLDVLFAKHVGTNVPISQVKKALGELQMAYRDRGYFTVQATLPAQQLTNSIVKIRVFEGVVSEVAVRNNRHFSSNNIARALPSLRTNTILNGNVFQAELDRANANRDRQVYPQLRPGPEPGTTALDLNVKDRLPLHARVELNNQRTPNTPRMRVNTTAAYNNLWQLEHSLGVQYGFSPENLKGTEYPIYDRPLIANYSAYYRFPLGSPDSLSDRIQENPTSFGYDEVSRKFRLPPSTGRPEINVYASRSVVDTGVQEGPLKPITHTTTLDVDQVDVSQDLTTTESLGARFSMSLPDINRLRSAISVGLDYKLYHATSMKTNVFLTVAHQLDGDGNPTNYVSSPSSPVPTTYRSIDYLPLSIRWDASLPDQGSRGVTSFGLGYTPNIGPAISSGATSYQNISGSAKSTGWYHVVNATITRDQPLPLGASLIARLDGQWASEPLISNEQFGIGGTLGVRGYREGEVYGDSGWRAILEPRTPAFDLGLVDNTTPLMLRGSVFMDYGESYLSDPNGRSDRTSLWGTGLGITMNLGYHWDFRASVAWALKDAEHVAAGTHFAYFSFSAQF